ncbi:MHYT domain-containing protein [Alteromonas stellipolaris]|uniref:MHYT domain-containing protein n=1 Tax=Alteromonas stellipolaris TaxID=233316 RepID=UPI0026E46140|nr:MHYT domain-containing protein [Alteromonas stellipolaris]MDO6534140.1 MHYT domain-containing protein [Alteromonas stellipolaris]MDO6625966.1 MHYT domain-containing protein [Alteromonas stellipolaris]
MIQEYFTIGQEVTLLDGSYDFGLVALSLTIAIFASFMAFNVATQAAVSTNKFRKYTLLSAGSIAMGGGIWAMHFLGMLAFELCTAVSYDVGITLASALPGIAAAWVALYLMTKPTISFTEILTGGVLVGSGIGTMHYSGMAAMEMSPLLRYSPSLFILSIVVAVCLAMLALWIKFGLSAVGIKKSSLGRDALIASIVMGLAIAGMHYTGMLAARFVMPPGMEFTSQPSEISIYLALSIAMVTVTLIALVLGITLLFKYKDVSSRAIESERIQRAITDIAVDAIITVDSTGIIKTANPAVTAVTGYSPEELIGQQGKILAPDDKKSIYSSDFFEQKSVPTEQIIGTSREVVIVGKGGEYIPVRVGIGYTKVDGKALFVGFFSDLRKRKAMEDALRESEAKFRSFISNIPGMAYRCLNEPNWPMEFISQAVSEITGYAADDFILPHPKITFGSLCHPDDVARVEAEVAAHKAFSIEYRIINKAGDIRWVTEHGVHVLDEQGNTIYLDGFISDITARREMEEELKAAKERAEQAAAARTNFLANMSHEIRTPMNAIIGFSDLMLAEKMPPEQHGHLTTVNRSARSLLHLLNDILDSAKLDKGKLDLDYRDFIIREEVDTVISTFWLEAKRKRISLEVQVGSEVREAYNGVPERIRQVLNNLIGNAVKFTGDGSVVLEVSSDSSFVYFKVKDSGIGMNSEQVNRVFDAFAQADASMSRKYGGTGLGTTISKQLVELMGGNICAQSELGVGSTFTFRLPLVPAKAPMAMEEGKPVQLPPMHILIVDDIAQNIDLLSLLLSRSGHTVEVARDGQEALEKMNIPGIELVLMDLQMPVLDGLEASILRRKYEVEHGLPPMPIIALTASVLVQDRHAATDAGMDGFANKPIDYPVLTREMARVLGKEIDESATLVVNNDKSEKPKLSKVVNVNRAIMLWGDAQTHRNEVERFTRENEAKIAQIRTAILDNDAAKTASLAHGIKGVAGNLCLNPLMSVCRDIEKNAHAGELDISTVQILKKSFNEVITWLQGTHESKMVHVKQDVNYTVLLEHLTKLKQSVEQNMLDEDELQEVKALAGGEYKDTIASIIMDIDDFEFERAEAQLVELIDTLATETETQ